MIDRCRFFVFLCALLCAVIARPNVQGVALNLVWDPSTDPEVIGYNVYVQSDLEEFPNVFPAGAATSMALQGLELGRSYEIWVTCYDDLALESWPSESVFYEPEYEGLLVTWEPAYKPNLRNYKLFYGITNGVSSSVDAGTELSTVLTNVVGGAAYFFYVVSYQTNGTMLDLYPQVLYTTPASGPLGVVSLTLPNAAPLITLTSPVTGSNFLNTASIPLTVTASDPDGTVARVEYFAGNTRILSIATPPFSGSWTGAAAGTHGIKAIATDNEGAITQTATATITVTNPTPLPAAPGSLTATPQSSSWIRLSWVNVATNETGYYVYRLAPGGTWGRIATNSATSTSYLHTGLQSASTYQYRVTAFNSQGESQAATASATTFPARPPTPTGLIATAGNAVVNLRWNAAARTELYHIYRSTATDGGFVWLNSTAVTNYADLAVTNGITYFYSITAENDGGVSAGTAAVSATPVGPAVQPPAAPTLTSVLPIVGGLYISWADNSTNETHFGVERSLDNLAFSQIAQVAANGRSMTDASVVGGTRYYYRVRAHVNGASSVSGVLSAIAQ